MIVAEPFTSTGQTVLDVSRLLVAFLSALSAAYLLALILRAPGRGTQLRLASAAVLVLIIGASRVENLGQPITWQFVAGAVAVLVMGAAAWSDYRDPTYGRTGR